MLVLSQIVDYCNERLKVGAIEDFPGAHNGLQVDNSGKVSKIGAAVDASLHTFELAQKERVDCLLVHHGLFWEPWCRVTGTHYQRIRALIEGDCALYSAHLPLDAHPEIGNNAQLISALGLSVLEPFLSFRGTDIGLISDLPMGLDLLKDKLEILLQHPVQALEYGSGAPKRIGFCSGRGSGALDALPLSGIDTLVTGELKQADFAKVQELGLNVFLCGHYATETLGVQALAKEVAQRFDLEWVFLPSPCPL